MSLNSLRDLYLLQLHELYSTETRLLEALPEMIEQASSIDLRRVLTEHLEVTRNQRKRLNSLFGNLEEKPAKETFLTINSMIQESDKVLELGGSAMVKDAAIIAAAQKVEHFEIAGYGCARTYAEWLAYESDAKILDEILQEEREADRQLTEIAQSHINAEALLRR